MGTTRKARPLANYEAVIGADVIHPEYDHRRGRIVGLDDLTKRAKVVWHGRPGRTWVLINRLRKP